MGRRGGSQPIGPKTPTVLGPTPPAAAAAAPAPGTRITGQRKERTNNSDNGDFVAPRTPPRSVRRSGRAVNKQGPSSSSQSSQKGKKNSMSLSEMLGSPSTQDDPDSDVEGTPGSGSVAVNRLPTRELVNQVVQYILILQAKKIPIKKNEIIKEAMNRQSREFQVVIDEVGEVLKDVFGCQLVGFKGNFIDKVALHEANVFMAISAMKVNVMDMMGDFDADNAWRKEERAKQGFVRAVLVCFFMLNREVDEETLWSMMTTLKAEEFLCPRREDLRKFLKTEFVDPMYLSRIEIKGVESTVFKYSWGARAEIECDKYEMLKHVATTMGKKVHDFKTQYMELLGDAKYRNAMLEDQKAPEGRSELDNTDEEREEDAVDAESELEEISEDQETPSEETTKKTSRKRVVVPSSSDDSD